MAYGFAVYASNGDVVVDDTSFAYAVGSSENSNSYSIPPLWNAANIRGPVSVEDEEILFCDFPVGKTLYCGSGFLLSGVSQNGIFITENTDFYRAKPFDNAQVPSYGLAVFDDQGRPTFHTGQTLVTTLDVHSQFIPINQTTNPQNVTINSDTTHICLASALIATRLVSPPTAVAIGVTCKRTAVDNVLMETHYLGSADTNNDYVFPATISFITSQFI